MYKHRTMMRGGDTDREIVSDQEIMIILLKVSRKRKEHVSSKVRASLYPFFAVTVVPGY